MRYRLPILSLVCFLLATLAFVRPGADRENQIAFTLPSIDGITTIEIRRTGQPDVELRFTNRWLIAPEGATIDPGALTGLLEMFSSSVPMDYAVADTSDHQQYGLSEHSITVTMKRADAVAASFRIGKVVDGRRTFIQDIATGRTFRAQADLRTLVDRPAFDWRDRTFFKKTFGDIQSIRRVEGPSTLWHIAREKNGGPWRAVLPESIDVGQREADSIANTLATAEAIALGSQDTFKVEFSLVAQTFDRETLSLEFGSEAQDGSIHVRLPGKPVMRLPRHQKIFLLARSEDLRNRRIFDMKPNSVVGLSLAGPENLILTNQEAWMIQSPPPRSSMNRRQGDAFLEALLSLKASGFGTTSQFRKAEDQLVIRQRDNTIVTLEIGAAFGKGRYARIKDAPNQVFILPASAVQLIQTPRAVLLPQKN